VATVLDEEFETVLARIALVATREGYSAKVVGGVEVRIVARGREERWSAAGGKPFLADSRGSRSDRAWRALGTKLRK